jgi:3-carboxy-cis,cis-muconate cycloisomerase
MSELLDALLGDAEASAPFATRARIQAVLDVVVALAEAQAAGGIVPAAALGPIRAAARAEFYDPAQLGAAARTAGNFTIPLVRALTTRVEAVEPASAAWVHFGATSQDLLDTALVLQLRAAVPVVIRSLRRAADAAARHAAQHARTPMAGRSWLQHGVPITFGLKAAGWCDALDRTATRLEDALAQASVLQLGGAAGTLAALGGDALPTAERMARALQLALPAVPWHAHRDRLAELAAALGVATGVVGKIGRDVVLLAQTEVGEVTEGTPGGSSTMPQKRNPVAATVAVSASHRTPGLVATVLGAMVQEHERAAGAWQAEWETFPDLVTVAAGGARSVADSLESLVIDTGRMRANLERTRGLISAEAAAMALAAAIGKHRAHEILQEAAGRAVATDRPLADILAEDHEIAGRFSRAELERLLDPAHYLGASEELVARVLGSRGGARA